MVFFQLLCWLVSFYFVDQVSDLPIVYFKTVSFFLSVGWFASCNEVHNTCLWKVFFFLSSLETKLARASSQSPKRSAESFIVLWNPHIIFSKLVVPFEEYVISLLFSCLVGCKMARICIGPAQEKIFFLTGGIVLSEFQRIPLFCN